MKHIYSFLLTALMIVNGFIAVSAKALEPYPWCDSLAYDGGEYWTVRVPITVENKSGVPLVGDQFRVTVSKTDGTSALIGESVAGLRVASSNLVVEGVNRNRTIYKWSGVEYLFELENEDGQRKRNGVLVAGDVITLPAEADVDSTITLFLYAGNSEAWLPPDIRDFRGKSARNVINGWLEVTEESKQLRDGVRVRVMPAETRKLSVQRDGSSWTAGREWPYRVPLHVRNLSGRTIHSGVFTVKTRHVNNRIGKLLGFDVRPSLLLIDPRRPERSRDIEGNLAESIRSSISIEPFTERTLWLYVSPNPQIEDKSRNVEFPFANTGYPSGLDVRAGVFESIEPQSWPLAAWSVDPLVKVFRQDIQPMDSVNQSKVYASRNSRKSFQVAIRSADDSNVEIQITDLKNTNGSKLPVPKIFKVGYVPVDTPVWYSSFPTTNYIRFHPSIPRSDGWCDWWPDPLIPIDNNSRTKLQANSTQPVWFDVDVPANAEPGTYRGQIIIKADTGNIYVPVEVKVWNLVLPDERHIPVIYDHHGSKKDVRFFARYNVSPGYVGAQLKFTYENGQVSMDATEYDEMAEFLIEELHNTWLYAPGFFVEFVEWFRGAKSIFGLEPFSPEYVKAYKDAYRLFIDHITEKGWRKNFVLYLSDEPRTTDIYDHIARIADLSKEVAPDVPIYVSSWHYIDEIAGHITAWGVGAKGTFPVELIEELKKKGDIFYYTTDGEQVLDTPFPATERLMPWFCFKYGVKGFEFWACRGWSYNPWKYGWHTVDVPSWDPRGRASRGPNGDAYIVYPGDEIGLSGLVPSIRLVAVREGVDDFEIFFALNKFADEGNRAAQKALDKVRSMVIDPYPIGFISTSFMPDPDAVSEARVSAGELLDDLLGDLPL